MTAGLPGAGIGGLFYLASALLMPVRALLLTLTGRAHEARWRLALRQCSLALGVIGALWATGWLLGWALDRPARGGALAAARWAGAAGVRRDAAMANALGAHAFAFSIATLLLVLLLVQVARALVAPPAPPSAQRSAEPARPARRASNARTAA